ncbi:MAG: cation-translocating P-type ATPase, partial [Desulfobacterales bacterium]|nr:cation-translocating P-type ATPase [Desulfobacterales bacterium]
RALFNPSPKGLTSTEAARRLERYGLNELREAAKRSPLAMLLDQFRDPMIILLLVAAVVSGVIGESQDTIVILVIVILNSIIGFVQEYRAEKAMAALKAMAAPWAVVIRDGVVTRIAARDLVAGDLVELEAGMIVPADLRLVETSVLKIDEAPLTGESVPVEKNTLRIADAAPPLGDRKNMAYRGTRVTYGRGLGVVVATGMATEMGRIAGLLEETEELKTPLQRRLARVGRNLAVAAILICAVVFVFGILRGEDVMLMFLTAVSLAVAAVPEALPAVVTISLAIGARQMIKHQALIRRLPAVETLGSTTVICTDKTGTLTLNQMTVEQLLDADFQPITEVPPQVRDTPHVSPLGRLLLAMALSNDVKPDENGEPVGDPTEVAIYQKAAELGFAKEGLVDRYPRVAEIPFSSERQAMTTVHQTPDGDFLVFTKGGFEAVTDKCNDIDTRTAEQRLAEMAGAGLRTLAYGCRNLDVLPRELLPEQVENGLAFLGLSGALDPPRPEAGEAVRTCVAAGIRPVMITGDHPLTAANIALRLGIIDSREARVVTGRELAEMAPAELVEVVDRVAVYARVAPEQKLKLVAALQQRGEAVAMTGDGVNDAPALKKADIGISMGITGTDVAKEASSMILLDDNFATIVRAVREGRKIYDNICKFVKYTLTSNAGEIWTIFLAPFFGMPIPLLPIHILWINLVTDGAPGLALTAEPAEAEIMHRPPRPPDESFFARGLWQQIIWVGVLMGGVCLFTLKIALVNGWHWQTMVFTVLCLSQFGNSLAIRSDRDSLFKQGLLSNPFLFWAVLISVGLQLAIIYVPVLQSIFHTQALGPTELLIALGLSTLVFWGVELEKLLVRRGWIHY